MLQIWWAYVAFMTALLVATCEADTPANCSYHDIEGRWTLYEGQRTHNSSENCGSLGAVSRKLKVDLIYPDVAVDQFGNHGVWTVVYNQGFELTVNGRTYFAYSYYEKNGQNVSSFCDKTFPGWSHDVTLRHWSCFQGRKMAGQPVKYHQDPFSSPQGVAIVVEEQLRSVEERVNSANTSWRAALHRPFLGLTDTQLLRLRGGHRSWLGARPSVAEASRELKEAAARLPESFDWRDMQGESFVSPVRNQGVCGSCYAFSSVGMLEARLRVQTNNTVQLTLSPQDIVSCSSLSQGCEGGFPYLVAGRYGRDYGVVAETCNPYDGQDGSCASETCDRHYTSTYSYVGGYYGACNEQLMMLALMHGPLSVSFEVYPDFMNYKTGVYHHDESFHSRVEPFVVVNHAVLLVGYGFDEASQQKFWIVKNSWGEDWGEDGYFRICRGSDECGIESIAVEATPIP